MSKISSYLNGAHGRHVPTREDVLLDEVRRAAVPIVVGIGADNGLEKR